ncbi:hypothetical protein DFH07DRAFT_775826 [Mycena maculata]|uniref:Uncharacterized protein n=1 Tax=Mycena maculata TaxID=230809 RepID=A0AAD7IQA3_9AGAR|nr:hypothetical protein DFH07DRAFT_775826 [Mycena maculata]
MPQISERRSVYASFLDDLSLLTSASPQPVGSAQAVNELTELIPNLPPDQSKLLLPIFYLQLDLSLVPDSGAVDAMIAIMMNRYLPCVGGTVCALNVVAHLLQFSLVPTDTYPDLWPRVSVWMQFFHMYWRYIPGCNPSDEGQYKESLPRQPGPMLMRLVALLSVRAINLEEIVDGVGSRTALSIVIMEHISRVLAPPSSDLVL